MLAHFSSPWASYYHKTLTLTHVLVIFCYLVLQFYGSGMETETPVGSSQCLLVRVSDNRKLPCMSRPATLFTSV